MKKEIDVTFKYDEITQLYDEWTTRMDREVGTWAWYDVDERIWKKLRDAMDDANS